MPTLPGTVKVVPHSWYHMCLGVDTASGWVRYVLNGELVLDSALDNMKEPSTTKPSSLKGHLYIGKMEWNGIFYQSRQSVSNVNVFTGLMAVERMVGLTHGEECGTAGDYLAWGDMQWQLTGAMKGGEVTVEHLCSGDGSSTVLLTETFQMWEAFMVTCPKMKRPSAYR